MRFGINALRLSGQRLGIGRYIEYLLKDWDTMLKPGDEAVVYVREPFEKDELGLSDAFSVRHLPSRHDGVLWEHLVLARQWRETEVLFCPSYTVPVHYRGRLVVATHSVNEAERGSHPWWYHLTYRQRNKLCARRSDAVIVPSQTTKKHVEDLYVGKLSQRRNIPALIEAFARVKQSEGIPHKLLLFGPNVLKIPLDELVERLGIADSVVQTEGRIERHEEILPVYSGADLFVHPTAAEGFSLTIVEAMACGVPVITVGRGAVAEIVGDAAITVDAPTPELLEAEIRRVLTDPSVRASMRTASIDRAELFRLDSTARGTLEVM